MINKKIILKKISDLNKENVMSENNRKVLIAPSILAADFGHLSDEIKNVEQNGCDVIHVDVMDGHFVPNLTLGPCVVEAIRKETTLPLDVHLMIESPEDYIESFRKAGSDWITFHAEAVSDMGKIIEQIKQTGAKVGVSVRPKTPIDSLIPFLDKIDLILIMTVEPGFGGQSFMEDMIQKVRDLRPQFSGLISVDGGINSETALIAKEAGVDILVAGTSIFKHENRAEIIKELREAK